MTSSERSADGMSRRQLLAGIGAVGVVSLAGCAAANCYYYEGTSSGVVHATERVDTDGGVGAPFTVSHSDDVARLRVKVNGKVEYTTEATGSETRIDASAWSHTGAVHVLAFNGGGELVGEATGDIECAPV